MASTLARLTRFLSTDSGQGNGNAIPAVYGPRKAVLLIDASTSMDEKDWRPSRIAAARRAARAFEDRLAREEPDARVAVVSYSDTAQLVCGLTRAKNRARLAKAIRRITTIGSTNITAGLDAALQILRSRRPICQVVLLSDGHHNTGAGPRKVAERLKRFAVVESVGIGGSPSDVDEELLRSISSEYPDGTKRYRWIGDAEQLVQHFHHLAGRITRAS